MSVFFGKTVTRSGRSRFLRKNLGWHLILLQGGVQRVWKFFPASFRPDSEPTAVNKAFLNYTSAGDSYARLERVFPSESRDPAFSDRSFRSPPVWWFWKNWIAAKTFPEKSGNIKTIKFVLCIKKWKGSELCLIKYRASSGKKSRLVVCTTSEVSLSRKKIYKSSLEKKK